MREKHQKTQGCERWKEICSADLRLLCRAAPGQQKTSKCNLLTAVHMQYMCLCVCMLMLEYLHASEWRDETLREERKEG